MAITPQPQSISGSTSVDWSHYQLCPGVGVLPHQQTPRLVACRCSDPQWLTGPPRGDKVTSLVKVA